MTPQAAILCLSAIAFIMIATSTLFKQKDE